MSLQTVAKVAVIGGVAYIAYRVWQDGVTSDEPISFASLVSAPVSVDTSGTVTSSGDPIADYLQAQGLTPSQASGVSAGIYAESQGNPNAVNPSSGAYGIGQWLGARKAALFAQYGNNPSLQDQLDFLVSELNGGDSGGAAVLAQSDPLSTLTAYITKFMRPAPGAQTTGDLARGATKLGTANG